MEEVKQKKSTFEQVVIAFNVIAIIFMIVIVVKFGIVEECTNTMRSSFESTKMELMQFNQKFITYEGVITGSQIKALVETVNASNLENDGTELVVSINVRTNENQYVFKGGNAKNIK